MMKLQSRLRLALACLLSAAAAHVGAQTYPNKPIRMVVPFPAGGPTDVLARMVGQQMSALLGQPIVIDNKAGGNTIIGADTVAKAAPDGYTLLMAIDNTLVMNQFLYSRLPYDPLKDFQPIGKVAISPLIIVAAKDGPSNVDQLLDTAARRPDTVSYGFGTFTTQLGGELIKKIRKLQMLGVSYKGSAGTGQGLLTGDVTFIIDGVTTALPHIQEGRFKAIATLGSRPIPALANLPQLAKERGFANFDVAVWMGLVAPKGTPPAVVTALNKALKSTLEMPEVIQKLEGQGLLPDYSSPEKLQTYMAQEAAKWRPVIEEAKIKVD